MAEALGGHVNGGICLLKATKLCSRFDELEEMEECTSSIQSYWLRTMAIGFDTELAGLVTITD